MIRPNGYYWVQVIGCPKYVILDWDDESDCWFEGDSMISDATVTVIEGPIPKPGTTGAIIDDFINRRNIR